METKLSSTLYKLLDYDHTTFPTAGTVVTVPTRAIPTLLLSNATLPAGAGVTWSRANISSEVAGEDPSELVGMITGTNATV